jgi:hypothetical protein
MQAQARDVLVKIAGAAAADSPAEGFIPHPPSKWILTGKTLSLQPGHNWPMTLIEALNGRSDRLRICRVPTCGDPFVATDVRAEFCSSRCRQRSFYERHVQEQRQRKRDEYNAARRFRRKTKLHALRGRERTIKLELNRALRDE